MARRRTSNGNNHPNPFRAFLADKWVEIVIVVFLLGGGGYLLTSLTSLNREVGQVNTRLEGVETNLSDKLQGVEKGVSGRIANVEMQLADLKQLPQTVARLDEKVNRIGSDVDSLRTKLAEAIPPPLIFQRGNLSNENKLYGRQETSTQPRAIVGFRWELKNPVDPNNVIEARATVRNMPPEVKVGCEVEDDGKSCVITLTAPANVIDSISLPVAATVVIQVAN